MVTVPATGGNEWLEILTSSGAVVAKTGINPTDDWLTAVGAGGAYWSQGGVEHELTASKHGALASSGRSRAMPTVS